MNDSSGGQLMRGRMFMALMLAVVFTAPLAWGQNLVFNPGFDTGVTGWTAYPEAAIDWNPLDANGSPSSGSALVTNLSTTAGAVTGAYQCVDGIAGEEIFDFAVDILVPGGQTQTGYANVLVQWYGGMSCVGGVLGVVYSSEVDTSTPDVWVTTPDALQAPPGTQSARLRLSVRKFEDSGILQAHFDNVVFDPSIFVDGFESGDTSAWSATVP